MNEPTVGEKVAGLLLISAVFWISYAVDFRQFMVIRPASESSYEFFLLGWALTALLYLTDVRFRLTYLLASAAVLGHVYLWAVVQLYFGAVSPSKTAGGLVTFSAVTGILLIRRETWRRLFAFNAVVAATAMPLAMQETIALSGS